LIAAIAVSRDHKPDQTDERQRIEEAGGFVMWAGMFLLPHLIAISLSYLFSYQWKKKLNDFWCLQNGLLHILYGYFSFSLFRNIIFAVFVTYANQ
jgi:Protein phosphatase 2C